MQHALLNLRYLKESVVNLDELVATQNNSEAYQSLIKEALSEIDLELAILRSSLERAKLPINV